MANSIPLSLEEKTPIIDVHVHPIRWLVSEENLLNEMRLAGVDKAVLLALDLDPDVITRDEGLKYEILNDILGHSFFIDAFKILKTMEQILRLGSTPNTLVSGLVKRNPKKFLGFGSVNPSKDRNNVSEKLEEIEKLGLRGIKLIPTLQFFNPKKNKNLKSIFKYARERGWPILIHAGSDPGPFEIPTLRCVQDSHPENWRKAVRKTKNIVIFAHMGCYGRFEDRSWFFEAVDLAQKNSNIFLDTSAVSYHLEDKEITTHIRETCGFDQILFGTDTPVVHGTSMKHSLDVIRNSPHLSSDEKGLILGKNAQKLFHLNF